MGPLPYVMFWQKEYLSSSESRRLSLAAKGAFFDLIMFQWEDGLIPSEVVQIARMVGSDLKEFRKVWGEISGLYETCEGGIRLAKLHAQREEAIARCAKNIENGRLGGRPTKAEPKKAPPPNPNETQSKPTGLPIANPPPNPNETQSKPIPDPDPEDKEKQNVRARTEWGMEVPTVEEISLAFQLAGNPDPQNAAQTFFQAYASVGWLDGNGNKITDWRMKIGKWNSGDASRKAQASGATPKPGKVPKLANGGPVEAWEGPIARILRDDEDRQEWVSESGERWTRSFGIARQFKQLVKKLEDAA